MRTRPVWARLGVFAAGFLLVCWLCGALSLWMFLRYKQDFFEVRFIDVAFVFLPGRWDEYQRRRGDHYVQRALVALEAQQWRDALFLLRVGVAKSPENLEGRRRLAELLGRFGNAQAGLTVLEAGLSATSADPAYVRTYVTLLLNAQHDTRVRELADAALARPGLSTEMARLYAIAGATACFLRGDYDAAETYLNRPDTRTTPDGHVLRARIDWERGEQDRSVARLQGLLRNLPREKDEQAYLTLFACLIDLGRRAEAGDAALLHSVAFPRSLTARLNLLRVLRDRPDRSRYDRELERVFRDFATDPALGDQLATIAINTADVGLAERVAAIASQQNQAPEFGQLIVLLTRLAAREYDAVIAGVPVLPGTSPALEGWRAGLLAVAHFGRGENDLGELHLTRLLSSSPAQTDWLGFGTRLQDVRAHRAARQVLARAVEVDPLNQGALTQLIQLELETGVLEETPQHLALLLAMRRPAPAVLQRAYDQLGSDRLLFTPGRAALLRNLQLALARVPTAKAATIDRVN